MIDDDVLHRSQRRNLRQQTLTSKYKQRLVILSIAADVLAGDQPLHLFPVLQSKNKNWLVNSGILPASTHPHLCAHWAWARQLFLWFHFGAFVVHRVSCAAHCRFTRWFGLWNQRHFKLPMTYIGDLITYFHLYLLCYPYVMHAMLVSPSGTPLTKQKRQLWLHHNHVSCPQSQARALTVQMKNHAIHCVTLAPLITAIKKKKTSWANSMNHSLIRWMT